jgi:hypothetical protein
VIVRADEQTAARLAETAEKVRIDLIAAMTRSLANDYPYTYTLLTRAADTIDQLKTALAAGSQEPTT